jgi:hypothetical protein
MFVKEPIYEQFALKLAKNQCEARRPARTFTYRKPNSQHTSWPKRRDFPATCAAKARRRSRKRSVNFEVRYRLSFY